MRAASSANKYFVLCNSIFSPPEYLFALVTNADERPHLKDGIGVRAKMHADRGVIAVGIRLSWVEAVELRHWTAGSGCPARVSQTNMPLRYEVGSTLSSRIVLVFMSSLPVAFTCLPKYCLAFAESSSL